MPEYSKFSILYNNNKNIVKITQYDNTQEDNKAETMATSVESYANNAKQKDDTRSYQNSRKLNLM